MSKAYGIKPTDLYSLIEGNPYFRRFILLLRDIKSAQYLKKLNCDRCTILIVAALLSCITNVAFSAPPIGIEKPTAKKAEDLAKLRTVIDIKTVHPGQSFNLVLIFEIQPQWHIYWKNPGEGSPPPDVVVHVPEGFKVGKLRWPRPAEMASPFGTEYVYEKQAALFVPITAPEKLDDGQVEIKADVRWAVCKNICLWGSAIQTLKLTTSSKRDLSARDIQIDPEIKKLSRRLPKPLKNIQGSIKAKAFFSGSKLTITGPAHGFDRVRFFPGLTPGVVYTMRQILIHDDRFTISVDIEINRLNTLSKPIVLEGLVAIGSKLDDPSYEFQVHIDN